jgi:hypothetical protein
MHRVRDRERDKESNFAINTWKSKHNFTTNVQPKQ